MDEVYEGRVGSLLAATTAISEGIELPDTLRRITRAAMELVGARYGALGIVAPDGSLEQFIHLETPDAAVAGITRLPRAQGSHVSLLDDTSPTRHAYGDARPDASTSRRSGRDSFLGVPIRVRGETFGNLYLTDRREGAFTAEDEELLTALASSAAVAIDHARLYDQARRRNAWTRASAEFSAMLLSGDTEGALSRLAERCVSVADAALVCVVLPDGDGLRVHTARGPLAETIAVGRSLPRAGTLAAAAIDAGRPVIETGSEPRDIPTDSRLGPMMALPLRSTPAGIPGAITVARATGASRFRPEDLSMAADFADQASIALELTRSLADRQRLELLDERSRIARDLHDHVIQRLFATGLGLQSTAARSTEPQITERVLDAVGEVDRAIDDIRTAIFAMSTRDLPALRNRVLGLASEYSYELGFTPRVAFMGPVDLVADDGLADDAVAVVREALSNTLRHARARSVEVLVDGGGAELVVTVTDDGVGIPESPSRSSGLENLRSRAEARNGSFSVGPRAGGGTAMRWSVPVDPSVLATE